RGRARMTWRPGLVDLAAGRLGGRAVAANDEFFAPKENLLKPGRGAFIEGKYTERGKWMDGWETRRRREPGNDWCIIRLGVPGGRGGVGPWTWRPRATGARRWLAVTSPSARRSTC